MKDSNQITIFIVEDNKVYRMAIQSDIQNTFKDKNIEIHMFQTGEECMEKFKKLKPQVVILDYNLNSKYPDAADGIKVMDWMKKADKNIHIIMLTSEDNINIALKSFHHGASDYVVKTETQFRKINYSLLNLFKMIESKKETRKFKSMAMALSLLIAILIGSVITVQFLEPNLLK